MSANNEEQRAERLARGFLSGDISRRSFMRRAAGFSAVALSASSLGAVLAACSSTTSDEPSVTAGAVGTPTAGGTLKAALTGEPDTIDPATSTIYTGAQVYDNIFNKLIDLDPSNEFYGQLATAWNAPDDQTWVFDLVDTATFHNGEKFGPNDVVYTFERILNPKTASSYAPLYDAISKVEATGPTQVTFHLKTSFGPFLSNLANNGEIVNQKAIESSDPSRNAIGTGPFEFVEWVQGDHVTLKKNESYFLDGKPYLDGIEFRFLNVDQSRIDALQSGDLNWSDAVPLQQLETLKSDPSFTYVTSATAGIPDYVAMNTVEPPFDNKLVRQAVYWALDRDAIRQVAYFGAGESGIEEVPTGSSWYDDSPLVAPNIDKAKSLLAQANVTTPLKVEYLGLPQYPELLKTGEVMQQQLKEVGIDMEIKQVEVGVWFNAFVKGEYQITSAYQERTIDPDNFYALVIRSGGDINTTGYSNPAADQLIDQARTETDETTRFDLYKQLRQIVFEDSPVIFVHYETINYLMQKDVVGSTVNPTLELRMQDVGFTEGASS
ncbi:MAG TPA: ABC transporter substrate-binding protein [Actinomycetota bacterium]|nr:ABC transporter substrate-binding protein [Actinomycetota bacterium]